MTTTTNIAAKKTFKAYRATLNGNPVYVINEGALKASGERGLKVRPMHYAGYAGDHTPKIQYTYETPIWVKASSVTR